MLQLEHTLVVWLDLPDRPRIEAALTELITAEWDPYVKLVRAALEETEKCVIVGRSLNDPEGIGEPSVHSQRAFQAVEPEMSKRPMDQILVRGFHAAYVSSADFRMKLTSGLT